MKRRDFKAAILDLDGVVTRTATLHSLAWKEMFDAFLAQRAPRPGEDLSSFEIETDYLPYVDGMPRHDGIRSFLRARGIDLPDGDPDDPPDRETVHGLGARKNAIFLDLLERERVQTYEDAIEQIGRWRDRGVRLALVTSSRNGRRILKSAGLDGLFEVTVDGTDSERLRLPGKPAPDIFLHAARELGVDPGEAIAVEDAISGVQAGRAGGFGLVVGVARNGEDRLREAGADLVVRDLRRVDDASLPAESSIATRSGGDGTGSADPGRAPAPDAANPGMRSSARAGGREEAQREREHALDRIDGILDRLDGRRLALFFDYDGTLTPIVRRPEEATLSAAMRSLLRELASRVTVAIISGRDLADVRQMVEIEELHYAGSHGFDVAGPDGMRLEETAAEEHLLELDRAERELADRLAGIDGAWVERKRFAIAVHYREADDSEVERVERIVDEARAARAGLRKKGGKKIFEIQPDIPWDKGRAVVWLLEQMGLDGPDVLPVYVGDDVTDEDAFRALVGRGLGIRVGPPDEPTHAEYFLRDTDELEGFIRELLRRLPAS